MRMKVVSALGLLAVVAVNPAHAGPEINTSTGIVLADGKPAPGLAVHGYDVVAFFTESRPVRGDAKYAAAHGAATYRFASQAHLDAFKRDPAKYVPAYGGYCAFGVSVGAKFDGDPNYWKIVDGKLYLNLDAGIQQSWLKDIPGAIKKAEANWPSLEKQHPSKVK